jgi:hypothetical protein
MSTITDIYGRTIDVQIDVEGEDIYTLVGIILSVPTGTPQINAVLSIEGMAPAGYVPPPPPPPPPPTPEEIIADSTQSLQLSDVKSLAAQGRTDDALAALIQIMENQS